MSSSKIRPHTVIALIALPIAGLVTCAVLSKDEATPEKQRCAELIGQSDVRASRSRAPIAEAELQALKRCTQVPRYRHEAARALERELITIAMATDPADAPPRPPERAATPEGLDRRARSEARLKAEGVPINPNLPTIETADTVRVRTQQEVVDRAIALTIVALKGEGLEPEHVTRASKRFEAKDFFSPAERAFISDAIPSQTDRVQFTWRYECVGVMLWALSFDAKLAVPDRIVDAAHVAGISARLGPTRFREQAKLRSVKELLDEADLIYRYGWACVDARLKGEPLDSIDCGVVVERHRALNWLIGYQGQAWDDVSTDT